MTFFKRRDFLKKTFLSTAFFAGNVSLFATDNSSKENVETFPLDADSDYWLKIKKQFYDSGKKKFFNTASLGPSPKIVVNAITESLIQLEKEVNHGHKYSLAVNKKIADFLNVTTDEIAITRNTTEGINIAAYALNLKPGDEVVMTNEEHIGGAGIWISMAKERGIIVKIIELDPSGNDNLSPFKNAITPNTKVVMFSHVTCTRGFVLPAKEIVAFCRSKNIATCVDGAQAVGMIPVNVSEINPDFYAACGHKWLLGPKGTGFLYINKNILNQVKPVFVGAFTDKEYDINKVFITYQSVAQREEYGTRNIPIIIGLGAAVDFIQQIGINKVSERGNELATFFKKELIKNEQIELVTPLNSSNTGSIVTFRIKNKDNQKFETALRKKYHYFVRSIYENNLDALRVSCSIYNTESDLKNLLKIINIVCVESN